MANQTLDCKFNRQMTRVRMPSDFLGNHVARGEKTCSYCSLLLLVHHWGFRQGTRALDTMDGNYRGLGH